MAVKNIWDQREINLTLPFPGPCSSTQALRN